MNKEIQDLLQFVPPSEICPEVVFSKSICDNTTFEPQSNKASVAKHLRQDFVSICNSVPEHK